MQSKCFGEHPLVMLAASFNVVLQGIYENLSNVVLHDSDNCQSGVGRDTLPHPSPPLHLAVNEGLLAQRGVANVEAVKSLLFSFFGGNNTVVKQTF